MTIPLSLDNAANYQIQVQGVLHEHWSDYLGGLTIDVNRDREAPVTTLTGPVTDQAALLGVLNNLYDLGFPLLFVECNPLPATKEFGS